MAGEPQDLYRRLSGVMMGVFVVATIATGTVVAVAFIAQPTERPALVAFIDRLLHLVEISGLFALILDRLAEKR